MNDEMLEKYAPGLLKATYKIGNPGDTGTGIKMGMSVGDGLRLQIILTNGFKNLVNPLTWINDQAFAACWLIKELTILLEDPSADRNDV